MWLQKNQWDRKDGVNGIVAVAIDSDKCSQHAAKSGAIDKGSQNALKWAIDHLLTKGSTIALIHVKVKTTSFSGSSPSNSTPSEYY